MAIPKAVQRQLEQAEQMQAALVAATAEAPAEVITDASQLNPPPTAAPTPPAPQPTPPAAPSKSEDSIDWKARYLSLQGMYNAEVPQLRAQGKTQESQIAQMQRQIDALTTAAAKPAEPAKPTFDPDEVERFGQDMMTMINRHMTTAVSTIRSEVGAVLGQLDGRLKKLEGSVQGVAERTEKTLEAQFWDALASAHPDYEEIDASDGWKAWLADVDELTGHQRQALLAAAQKALDAPRVGKFFAAYKATLPKPASAAIAGQVSPASGGSNAAPAAPPAPRIFSNKFIQDFFKEVALGKWKGREAEAARIDAEITQAAAEGRIR